MLKLHLFPPHSGKISSEQRIACDRLACSITKFFPAIDSVCDHNQLQYMFGELQSCRTSKKTGKGTSHDYMLARESTSQTRRPLPEALHNIHVAVIGRTSSRETKGYLAAFKHLRRGGGGKDGKSIHYHTFHYETREPNCTIACFIYNFLGFGSSWLGKARGGRGSPALHREPEHLEQGKLQACCAKHRSLSSRIL